MVPNSYPRDGIFNLRLTTIKDSYTLILRDSFAGLSGISIIRRHYAKVKNLDLNCSIAISPPQPTLMQPWVPDISLYMMEIVRLCWVYWSGLRQMSRLMTKPKPTVRPAKTQIRLDGCPVWSESSLSAKRGHKIFEPGHDKTMGRKSHHSHYLLHVSS